MRFRGTLKQQWGTFMKHDLQENERSYGRIIGMLRNGTVVTVPAWSGSDMARTRTNS